MRQASTQSYSYSVQTNSKVLTKFRDAPMSITVHDTRHTGRLDDGKDGVAQWAFKAPLALADAAVAPTSADSYTRTETSYKALQGARKSNHYAHGRAAEAVALLVARLLTGFRRFAGRFRQWDVRGIHHALG